VVFASTTTPHHHLYNMDTGEVRDETDDCTVLVLGACPFAEIAATDPATVCALHRGLADGVAERVGGVEVEALEVADPAGGGCRVVLRRTAR